MQYSRCHLTGAEGKDHLSQPAGSAFPNAAQEGVGLCCPKGTFWLKFSFLSTITTPPPILSAQLLSIWLVPSLLLVQQIIPLWVRNVLNIPFAELCVSRLLRSL